MRIKTVLCSWIVTLGSIAGGPAHASTLEADLELALDYMEGTFDNYEQVYWERALGVPEHLRHPRATSIYKLVELPQFDGAVIYAHKYANGDPSAITFRNLYVIKPSPEENGLRLRIYPVPDADQIAGLPDDLSGLAHLDPAEIQTMAPDCDTLWKRRMEHFQITMAGECWLTTVHASGQPVSITVSTGLDASGMSYLSYGHGESGEQLYGPLDLVPSFEYRAREFACVAIEDSGGRQDFELYDEGGVASLELDGQPLHVRLRRVRIPGAAQSRFLALFLHGGELLEDATTHWRESDAAAVAEFDATEIALLRDSVTIRCKLET